MAASVNHENRTSDDVDSTEEDVDSTKECQSARDLSSALQLLHNQRNLAMFATLPASVKRRIKALKKLQLDATNTEAKFFKEVYELECKYHQLFQPLYEKRSTIVSGSYEPTDAECEWSSDDDDEHNLSGQLKSKAKIVELGEGEQVENRKEESSPAAAIPDDDNVRGIPDFWLTIFKNVNLLADMLQPHDEPILKNLVDIKTHFRAEPMGFTLEFHFATNEYFTNTVLTKSYEMKCVPDEEDPFNFEGPEIYKCTGCTINWHKGKNVTVKMVKKRQKHKSSGALRHVTKTVPNDSFFNFFTPPSIPDNMKEEDVDDELRSSLTSDFEIGHYMRERIVPRAVLLYTGEDVDDEDDEFEEDESEEEEEEEDGGDAGGNHHDEKNMKKQEQECKQQ